MSLSADSARTALMEVKIDSYEFSHFLLGVYLSRINPEA